MKAVIPIAGASSRMWPLATGYHKAFISVCGKPLVLRTIENLVQNGITEILLIVDPRDAERALGVAKGAAGAKVEVFQTSAHGGMGAELLAVKDRLPKEFILSSGHAVNAGENARGLLRLEGCDASFTVADCDDLSEYGAVEADASGIVRRIEEKPDTSAGRKRGMRIISVYRLDSAFVEQLSKEKPGHYSFESALGVLVGKGKVRCSMAKGYQPTLKYPWHLLELKNFIMDRELPSKPQVDKSAVVHRSAIIEGKVVVCAGASVMENAVVKGPAYIGKSAVVGTGALVRGHSDLEEGAVAGFACEIKNSLLMRSAHCHRSSVEDSLLGEESRVAAGAVLANRRFDRRNVGSAGKDGKMKDTGTDFFGAALGESAAVGVNASVMPGVKLGPHSSVMPNCVAMRDVAEGDVFGKPV